MATIQNTISMQDRMTPVFNRIIQAMSRTTNGMEAVNRSASRGIANRAFDRTNTSIGNANNQVNRFNNNIRETNSEAKKLSNTVNKVGKSKGSSMGLMNVYAGIQLAEQLLRAVAKSSEYLDNMALMESRVNMINDGHQTTAALQDKILASANRARASYEDTTAAVTKLNMLAADQFKTNQEAIDFVETLNKMFVISGTGAQESSSAMYQLTQAMASGKLQGDEFRSIMENAPMLAEAISKEMGVSKGELKELSSDGVITAEIIKNSMVSSAEDINKKFESMPMTFTQKIQQVKNKMMDIMEPVAAKFSQWLNSDEGNMLFDTLINGVVMFADVALLGINLITTGIGWIREQLGYLQPIIDGIKNGFMKIGGVVFLIAEWVVKGIEFIIQVISEIYPILIGIGAAILTYFAMPFLITAFTFLSVLPIIIADLWAMIPPLIAQAIAWLAINWPILLIAAAVGLLIYILVQFGVTTADVVGFVVGSFYYLCAIIENTLIGLYNGFSIFANFLGNLFIDPIGAIKMLFLDMALFIVNKVMWVAQSLQDLVNMIPGVEINITSGLESIVAKIENARNSVSEKHGVNKTEMKEYNNVTESFQTGFDKGSSFIDNLGNMGSIFDKFEMPKMTIGDSFGMGGMNSGMGAGSGLDDGKLKGGKLDEVGKIKDDVNITEEDIKLLKDISKAEFINKYTTLRPDMKVEFTGPVTETADINKIISAIEDMTEQALSNVIVEEVF